MGKKGKGKKKGKKKKEKKKPILSNLEKEVLQLKIENFQSKIEWRKELIDIMDDDIHVYNEAHENERRTEREIVNHLEKAIGELNLKNESFILAIPEAQSRKLQSEARQTRDLAQALLEAQKEKAIDDADIAAIVENWKSLDEYDAQDIENKILDLEMRLQNENNENLEAHVRIFRQKEALKAEMMNIFHEKSETFQEQLREQMSNNNLLRIAEETRWMEDCKSILDSTRERLERKNEKKRSTLLKERGELKSMGEKAIEDSEHLQDLGRNIKTQESRNRKLEEINKINKDNKEKKERINSLISKMREELADNNNILEKSLDDMEENEVLIIDTENVLSKEININVYLNDILTKSGNIIEKEVKDFVDENFERRSSSKNMRELKSLFQKTMLFIYQAKTTRKK